MLQENQPVHLLWTGGWDSTFRMLYLLIKEKKTVQAHYLIEPRRRSVSEELLARDKIREKLISRYPEVKSRLCPTKFFDVDELPDMPDVSISYRRLYERVPIGTQYEYMAKYCILMGLHDVETCIHTGGTANKLLDPVTQPIDTAEDHYYVMSYQYKDTDEYKLFGHYRFPLYDAHKGDMGRVANEYGWQDLLTLTWFCLKPLPDHTPCGRCHPCCMVMREGMTWRMPLKSRMMYYITLRPMEHSGSKVYKTMRQIKHLIMPRGSLSHRN